MNLASNVTNAVTDYEYNIDRNIIRETVSLNGRTAVTAYHYDNAGKLLRSIDPNGIVSEQDYDDKARVSKNKQYHVSEPSNAMYSEQKFGEKGELQADIDTRGGFDSVTYSSDVKSGNNISQTMANGQVVAFGYDCNDNEMLEITSSINGEANTNRFKYNLGMLTEVTHNDFSCDFGYDGQSRQISIHVAGRDYVNKGYFDKSSIVNGRITLPKYGACISCDTPTSTELQYLTVPTGSARYEVTNYANCERVVTIYDSDDNVLEVYFAGKHSEFVKYQENNYNSIGKLTKTIDYLD